MPRPYMEVLYERDRDSKERRRAAAGPLSGQGCAPAAGLPGSKVHSPQAHQAGRQAGGAGLPALRGERPAIIYQRRVLRHPQTGERLSDRRGPAAERRLRGRKPDPGGQKARSGRPPPRRGGIRQDPDRPHPGLPLRQGRMEAPGGEQLCPGPLQPHRPEHRRHRHRRQDRRGPADSEPEDQGPGAGEKVPLRGSRDPEAPGRNPGGLSLQGREAKPGLRHREAPARGQDRRDPLSDPGEPERPVPGGVRADHRPDPPDPGHDGRRRDPPAGRRQVRKAGQAL